MLSAATLVIAILLSGTVIDATTQTPIPDAHVAVPFSTEEVVVGHTGAFAFPLNPGRYDIYAWADGYEELRLLQVVLPAGAGKTVCSSTSVSPPAAFSSR